MGRPHIEPLLGGRVDPAVLNALARENQRMLTVSINHSKFQIAAERRVGGRFPHWASLTAASGCALI
jgi:hypothetical protein